MKGNAVNRPIKRVILSSDVSIVPHYFLNGVAVVRILKSKPTREIVFYREFSISVNNLFQALHVLES